MKFVTLCTSGIHIVQLRVCMCVCFLVSEEAEKAKCPPTLSEQKS